MKDIPVGGTVEFGDKVYKCVMGNDCNKYAFTSEKGCYDFSCSAMYRIDVIFKEVHDDNMAK